MLLANLVAASVVLQELPAGTSVAGEPTIVDGMLLVSFSDNICAGAAESFLMI